MVWADECKSTRAVPPAKSVTDPNTPPRGSGSENETCYDCRVFTYDANDRLTAVKVTGGGVAMGSAERDYYAAAGARPSRWAGYGLWAFLGACGAAMLLPLTLLGGSALGRRARRRRMVHGALVLERESVLVSLPPRKSVPVPFDGIGIPGTTGPRWESRSSPVQGRRARRRRMLHGVIALLLAVLMIVGPENVQAISQQAFASTARAGLLAFDHRDPTSEDMGYPHAQAMLRQAVGATEEAEMTKEKAVNR